MLRKIKKLWSILRYYFKDSDNLFLYLLEIKAYECLEGCYKLAVRNTEELEDLLFHIRTYLDIPKALIEFKYQELKGAHTKDIINKYKRKKLSKEELLKFTDFLLDVEKERTLERNFIFEHAKSLNFGFEF